jgi:outer membrane protein OmpA-like peptidoglycan-associated protein
MYLPRRVLWPDCNSVAGLILALSLLVNGTAMVEIAKRQAVGDSEPASPGLSKQGEVEMKFRNVLAGATILALPLAANAQPVTGIYVGAGAGINIMSSQRAELSVRRVDIPGSVDLSPQVGPAFSLSLGYGLGNGLRTEIEGSYRNNNFSGSTGTIGAITTSGTREQKMGAMVNVLYDFVGVSFVQPYIGAGVGYQWVKESGLHVRGADFSVNAPEDTQGKFAYQGIIGVAYPILSAPGLALTFDYRFMGLVGQRNYGAVTSTTGVGGGTVLSTVKLDHNYNNTIMVGVRYNFGVAPPPVAPAPAAVAPSPISRSYLVFFDWDKATLTDRARQIVSEAAANSTKVQYTRLEVNGYTDTSGTPAYNQGLSVRRAQAVAAELVKDGVPKSAIAIQGFGETHLLVPTGQGVREPQNRRVEIIIK